jgi:hypothetical protein
MKTLINSIKLAEQLCREDMGHPEGKEKVNNKIDVSVKKAKPTIKLPKEETKQVKPSKTENEQTPIKQKSRIKMRKVGNLQKENSAQMLGIKRLKSESN